MNFHPASRKRGLPQGAGSPAPLFSDVWLGRAAADLEQRGVLQRQRTRVREEHDPVEARVEARLHRTLAWIDDSPEFVAFAHEIASLLLAVKEARVRRGDHGQTALVDDLGLVGRIARLHGDHALARHEAHDGVEQRGVKGLGIGHRDVGKPELPALGGLVEPGPDDPRVSDELLWHVVGGYLDPEAVVMHGLEYAVGDPLGSLALAVAGEHAVDVGVVHGPEALADVHREGVGTWDHAD